MGEIRSALDIAMEKTAHIEGDKTTAENRELKTAGKRAASEYLEKHDASILESATAGKTAEQAKMIHNGAISIFLASIKLPLAKQDLERISAAGTGLSIILPETDIDKLFTQVQQILDHYLSEQDQVKQALEQQFMPRLRQKQQELERRYGQAIPMELHQDPEYNAAFSKNVRALETKYEAVISEVRARVRTMAGIED